MERENQTNGTTMESKSYSFTYNEIDSFNFWNNEKEDIYGENNGGK